MRSLKGGMGTTSTPLTPSISGSLNGSHRGLDVYHSDSNSSVGTGGCVPLLEVSVCP